MCSVPHIPAPHCLSLGNQHPLRRAEPDPQANLRQSPGDAEGQTVGMGTPVEEQVRPCEGQARARAVARKGVCSSPTPAASRLSKMHQKFPPASRLCPAFLTVINIPGKRYAQLAPICQGFGLVGSVPGDSGPVSPLWGVGIGIPGDRLTSLSSADSSAE